MIIQSRPWYQSKSLQCWLCFVAAVLFQGIGLASIVLGQGTTGQATSESKSKEGNKKLEKATFGGGCFWCTEAVFQRVKGVQSVVSGYTGGTVENPTYEQVCTGTTGHAEVIQIEFDPEVVPFAKLLEVHWKTHDPTTLNKQGYDEGTQYRSAIFYENDSQKKIAEEYKAKLNKEVFDGKIVTEISPLTKFYPAEKYHQNYFNLNARKNPYCQAVIVPKLKKFDEVFNDIKKDDVKK
ncbi:MAG: peptide-methionine (S)-S-oxide reductase MsrA [Pirellula sp.]